MNIDLNIDINIEIEEKSSILFYIPLTIYLIYDKNIHS